MSTSTADTRSRSSSSVPSTASSTTTDSTPIIPPAAPLDSHRAPNKAEFLAIQSGLKRRPGLEPSASASASLHTSTYSVAATATAGEGSDDDDVSEDSTSASASGDSRTPASASSAGAQQQSRLRRQLYGLQGPGSPEGSTFALPYGTSRNGSVETFATVNSDDLRRGGYSNPGDESDFDMLEDPRS